MSDSYVLFTGDGSSLEAVWPGRPIAGASAAYFSIIARKSAGLWAAEICRRWGKVWRRRTHISPDASPVS